PLIACLGETVIGGAEINLSTEAANNIELTVLPAHRRRRFGTSLAEAIEELIRAEATSPLVQTETCPRAGTAFAEARGMAVGIEEHRLLLDLPAYLHADADRYKVSGASTTVPVIRDDPDFSITSWIGPCDEENLDSWARLRAQMDEDVPAGGLTRVAKHADAKAIRCYEQRKIGRAHV